MKYLSVMLFFIGTSVFLHAEEIYAVFNVKADKSANLSFTATGIVKNVHVDIADHVIEGQKLAELESADLQNALEVAKADLNNTEVALKFAKRNYLRENKVKQLISELQHDQVIRAYESAQTSRAQKQASVGYQLAQLDKTVLRAPFDGVIYDKEIEAGDAVSGAMIRTVFKVHNIDRVKLILEFDQKYWDKVKVGQHYRYRIEGNSAEHKGVISKIYPYANSNNRKVKAEVIASGFVPGLFGDGVIITDTAK